MTAAVAEFISVQEFAVRVGVAKQAAYRAIKRDEVPGVYRVGGRVTVNWSAFVAATYERTSVPRAEHDTRDDGRRLFAPIGHGGGIVRERYRGVMSEESAHGCHVHTTGDQLGRGEVPDFQQGEIEGSDAPVPVAEIAGCRDPLLVAAVRAADLPGSAEGLTARARGPKGGSFWVRGKNEAVWGQVDAGAGRRLLHLFPPVGQHLERGSLEGQGPFLAGFGVPDIPLPLSVAFHGRVDVECSILEVHVGPPQGAKLPSPDARHRRQGDGGRQGAAAPVGRFGDHAGDRVGIDLPNGRPDVFGRGGIVGGHRVDQVPFSAPG